MTRILHLEVSPHAAERYRERFMGGEGSLEEAISRLREIFRSSRRLHAQANDRALFEGPAPDRVRMVVRWPGTRDAAVLTVLFPVDSLLTPDEAGELYGPPLEAPKKKHRRRG